MANNLDSNSKNILTGRPVIEFQEPPRLQDEFPPELIGPIPQTLDEVNEKIDEVLSDLNKVIQVSDFLQAKIDTVAKNVAIRLDSVVDSAVVAAMKRQFPELDPVTITFQTYRLCMDWLNQKARSHNEAVLKQSSSEEAMIQALSDPFNLGKMMGISTSNGMTRSDLDQTMRFVEPVDMAQVQEDQTDQLFEKIRPRIAAMIETTRHQPTEDSEIVTHLPPRE